LSISLVALLSINTIRNDLSIGDAIKQQLPNLEDSFPRFWSTVESLAGSTDEYGYVKEFI